MHGGGKPADKAATRVGAGADSMALLFYSPDEDAQAWRRALLHRLPDLDFRAWPDTGDLAEIDAALVWRVPRPAAHAAQPQGCAVAGCRGRCHAGRSDLARAAAVPAIDRSLTRMMSEFVLLLVLKYHRGLDVYAAQQRQALWQFQLPPVPEATRVGILGLGELGADAAAFCPAMASRSAAGAARKNGCPESTRYAGAAELAEFLGQTDILVCLLPLTADTVGILDARLFAQLPPGARLINVARGQHLVEPDLLEALERAARACEPRRAVTRAAAGGASVLAPSAHRPDPAHRQLQRARDRRRRRRGEPAPPARRAAAAQRRRPAARLLSDRATMENADARFDDHGGPAEGGAGKTTLVIQLATALTAMGRKVALVDIHLQGSLTGWMRLREHRQREAPELRFSMIGGWRLGVELDRLRKEAQIIIVDTPPTPRSTPRPRSAARIWSWSPASRARSTLGQPGHGRAGGQGAAPGRHPQPRPRPRPLDRGRPQRHAGAGRPLPGDAAGQPAGVRDQRDGGAGGGRERGQERGGGRGAGVGGGCGEAARVGPERDDAFLVNGEPVNGNSFTWNTWPIKITKVYRELHAVSIHEGNRVPIV